MNFSDVKFGISSCTYPCSDAVAISLEVGTKGIDADHLIKFLSIAKFLNASILRTLPGTINVKPDHSQI